MTPEQEPNLTPAQDADLSALADGTIDPRRREAVRAWALSSPALRKRYEREQFAVRILHDAWTDRAPPHLRARIESDRLAARGPTRTRYRFALALALPIAAAIVVLALALPTGTPGGPSLSQAASLALRGPQQTGPAADPLHRGRLAQSVQDVYFPNWAASLGWHAVGQRQDRLDGRLSVTVYYARGRARVAYTIVSSPALRQPAVRRRRVSGVDLRTLTISRRTVVTWQRDGHTCVISAHGVSATVLQQLAGWRYQRAG